MSGELIVRNHVFGSIMSIRIVNQTNYVYLPSYLLSYLYVFLQAQGLATHSISIGPILPFYAFSCYVSILYGHMPMQ